MKWHGETYHQRREREIADWWRAFVLFPVQTREGPWIWLQRGWVIREAGTLNGPVYTWSSSEAKPTDNPNVNRHRPPPPTGHSAIKRKE